LYTGAWPAAHGSWEIPNAVRGVGNTAGFAGSPGLAAHAGWPVHGFCLTPRAEFATNPEHWYSNQSWIRFGKLDERFDLGASAADNCFDTQTRPLWVLGWVMEDAGILLYASMPFPFPAIGI